MPFKPLQKQHAKYAVRSSNSDVFRDEKARVSHWTEHLTSKPDPEPSRVP
jgi:hypothetical protein